MCLILGWFRWIDIIADVIRHQLPLDRIFKNSVEKSVKASYGFRCIAIFELASVQLFDMARGELLESHVPKSREDMIVKVLAINAIGVDPNMGFPYLLKPIVYELLDRLLWPRCEVPLLLFQLGLIQLLLRFCIGFTGEVFAFSIL